MVKVLLQLEVMEEQKKNLTATLPGLGDVLRGTPSLRPVPADLPTCSLSVPG